MTNEDTNPSAEAVVAPAETGETPAADTAAPSVGTTAPAGDAKEKAAAGPPQIFTFADMKLGVGDRLQIQLPAHLRSERAFVKVVGYLDNVSLIVTAPSRNGSRLNLLENEILIVRAFSRQSAFAFNCSILRVCKLPFDYLHLSFPRRIQGTVIRKSTRVRAGFAAQAGGAGSPSGAATIDNISATGALVAAREPLGNPGDTVRLSFQVHLHDVDSALEVEAKILSAVPHDDAHGEGAPLLHHGVEFRNLQPKDRMIITSFVYQQIIERPHSVV